MSRRGWLLFAAMCVIWGIPYLLIKVAVRDFSPAGVVFLRTAVGSLLLLPMTARREVWRTLLAHWRWLLIYTVVEVAVPWFLLSNAERRLSSSLSGVLVSTVPLIGALVVWLVGGDERPGPRRVAGLIIGLGGVVALLGLNVTTGDLGAVGQILLVAVGYALGPLIIARRLVDLPAGGVVVTSLALSAFAYAPAFAFSIPHHLPAGTAVAAIAVLAVVCTAIAFLVFFRLIAEVGPIRSTVITYVNPAVAVVLGVAFLHERFTVGTGIGFVLILAGCYLATVRTAPRRTPVPALVPEP